MLGLGVGVACAGSAWSAAVALLRPAPVFPRSCIHRSTGQGPRALEAWPGQGWAAGNGGVFKANLARGKEELHFSPQHAWVPHMPLLPSS